MRQYRKSIYVTHPNLVRILVEIGVIALDKEPSNLVRGLSSTCSGSGGSCCRSRRRRGGSSRGILSIGLSALCLLRVTV